MRRALRCLRRPIFSFRRSSMSEPPRSSSASLFSASSLLYFRVADFWPSLCSAAVIVDCSTIVRRQFNRSRASSTSNSFSRFTCSVLATYNTRLPSHLSIEPRAQLISPLKSKPQPVAIWRRSLRACDAFSAFLILPLISKDMPKGEPVQWGRICGGASHDPRPGIHLTSRTEHDRIRRSSSESTDGSIYTAEADLLSARAPPRSAPYSWT